MLYEVRAAWSVVSWLLRVSIRYVNRKATAGDHAAGAVDGGCEVGSLALRALIRGCVTVLGTHR